MPAAAGLVVDASVALKWLIEEDGTPAEVFGAPKSGRARAFLASHFDRNR